MENLYYRMNSTGSTSLQGSSTCPLLGKLCQKNLQLKHLLYLSAWVKCLRIN